MVVCTLDKLSITVRVCYPNISCLIPPHVHQHTHWAGFDAVLSSSCILLMLLVAFTMVRLMGARPCKLADRPPGTACSGIHNGEAMGARPCKLADRPPGTACKDLLHGTHGLLASHQQLCWLRGIDIAEKL